MKHTINFIVLFLTGFSILATTSCTNLEEELNNGVVAPTSGDGGDGGGGDAGGATTTLTAVIDHFRLIVQPASGGIAQLQENTSDELIAPTRGPDWDDAGEWRALHNHQFEPTGSNGVKLRNTFNDLIKGLMLSSDLILTSSSASDIAQARFIRAYLNWQLLDLYGHALDVSEVANGAIAKKKALQGVVAVDYLLAELQKTNDGLSDGKLTATTEAYVPNRFAIYALSMKLYLNKAVYALDRTKASTKSAPSFASADMDKVVELADQIISSGVYSLQSNYFENFAPDNDAKSKELIFTSQSIPADSKSEVRSRWLCGSHYNMNPGGWNGFCTLADFYNQFDSTDARLEASYPGWTDKTGTKVGFLFGQQVDQFGDNLLDRKGAPLFFKKDVEHILKQADLEIKGIRVYKYVPDLANANFADNDFVVFRYADVLLMKAEALLRGAAASSTAPATASDIMTMLGKVRNNTQTATTLDNILAERGRELYWENHRRTDLLRFNKFFDSRPTKNEGKVSDAKYALFPIPNPSVGSKATQISQQNPGY